MTQEQLEIWIRQLIKDDNLSKFYKSKYWRGDRHTRGLKDEVIEEQNYECQECKKLGKITIADTVHHVQFVRKHPRLALSKFYTYNGQTYKNLIAVCKECHNKLHPEKHRSKRSSFSNNERW